jgi:hypothetical protein
MLVGHRQPTGPVPIRETGPVDRVDLPDLVRRLGPPWVLRRRASRRRRGQPRAAEAALQGADAGNGRLGPALSQDHPDQAAPPTRVTMFQPAGAAVHPDVGAGSRVAAPVVIRPQTRFTPIAEASPDPAHRVVGEAQVEGDPPEILTRLMALNDRLTNGHGNRAGHDTLPPRYGQVESRRASPTITHVYPPRQNLATPSKGFNFTSRDK